MATTQIFARIQSKPEHVDAVRATLLELVQGSRTEPGVIFYELVGELRNPDVRR